MSSVRWQGAWAGVVLTLALQVQVARAHAPLARALLVTAEGGLVLHLPGFGLVVQERPGGPFAYACDALLGISPLAQTLTWAQEAEGTLLLGNEDGLRRVGAGGCGLEELGTIGFAGIAVAADGTLYAITGGTADPELYRNPAPNAFESRLPLGGVVTALVTDANEVGHLYVSRLTGDGTTLVLASTDGGSTFSSTEHSGELTLVHAASGTLFALSKRPPPAEVILVRSIGEQPFEEVHRVRFFGGFTVSNGGATLWIGDEAGGLFRSSDGGDTFENVQPTLATACLAHRDGAIYACTPGLTTMPALRVSRDDGASFEDVVTLADVDRLVECPGTEVTEVCAQAWVEWQRDVRLLASDAGIAEPMRPEGGLADSDAMAADAGADRANVRPKPRPSDGCQAGRLAAIDRGSPAVALAGVLLALLATLRHERRTRA